MKKFPQFLKENNYNDFYKLLKDTLYKTTKQLIDNPKQNYGKAIEYLGDL